MTMPPRPIPTLADFEAYDGAHAAVLWRSVGPEWVCPGCDRSKFQILRWTKRLPKSTNGFMGWIAPLHKHHDHSVGFFERSVRRFTETLMCDQCNSADGHAKRRLKLPENFSFSPNEIRQFVTAAPHERHRIDVQCAIAIYRALTSNEAVVTPFWATPPR
jgi:hypothetical protein